MTTITGRVRQVEQPRGGYVKPSMFTVTVFDDGRTLGEENISPVLMGTVVDYLSRFMMSGDIKSAFSIPILGYGNRMRLPQHCKDDCKKKLDIASLLENIKGLDERSIICACKACSYDAWYRNLVEAMSSKGAEDINPDAGTVNNIRIMVERVLSHWSKCGSVVKDGITFEGGYTDTVSRGDGDFLTVDTLWDLKVSKSMITKNHTLQIVMYWIMGQHSGKEEFKSVSKLGFFNPRLNTSYVLDVDRIPKETIRDIECDVIGYR